MNIYILAFFDTYFNGTASQAFNTKDCNPLTPNIIIRSGPTIFPSI